MRYLVIRETVISTCRSLADKGFLAGTGGNVAVRADDENLAVTPSATDYYSMAPEDVCIVRLNDLAKVDGDRKPSVESGLHARVLNARADCRVSIHTHQPIASAFTLLARPLEIQHPVYRRLLGDRLPCAGYAPSGTSWLARNVAKSIRNHVHAFLMRNHGVVCVGADVDVAMRRVEALELACADFFHRQLTQESPGIPTAVNTAVRNALPSRAIGKT